MNRREDGEAYFKKALQIWNQGMPKTITKVRERWHAWGLTMRKYDVAKLLYTCGWLPKALEYSEMALCESKTKCEDENDMLVECFMLKSALLYSEICFFMEQLGESKKNYGMVLNHVESKYKVGVDVEETRYYIKAAKGMHLCYVKQENLPEAEEYLRLATEQAEKIYERTGLEKDRILLEEVLSIKG